MHVSLSLPLDLLLTCPTYQGLHTRDAREAAKEARPYPFGGAGQFGGCGFLVNDLEPLIPPLRFLLGPLHGATHCPSQLLEANEQTHGH